MVLIPLPLLPDARRRRAEEIRERLRDNSFEEIVEQELELYYTPDSIEHPVTRRLHENAAIVYTREELRFLVTSSLRDVLDEEGGQDG